MPMLNTHVTHYQALQRSVEKFSRLPALTFRDETITYHQLGERVDSLARKLRGLGVQPGDKIAIIIPNSLDYVFAFYAPSAIGAVIVPINPVYREQEFQSILEDAEAYVVIASAGPAGSDVLGTIARLRPLLPKLRHLLTPGEAPDGFVSLADLAEDPRPLPPPGAPEDLCALIYTSGTVGVPKAVMESHRSMITAVIQGGGMFNDPPLKRMYHAARLVGRYGWRFVKWGLRQYTGGSLAPMHALLGYSALVYGLTYGFRIVIVERFHPARVLELIERERMNILITSPTMIMAMLNSPEFAHTDVSSLIYVVASSAPCTPELARRARRELGCPVRIAFAATETGGVCMMTNDFDPEPYVSETVGRCFPGTEAKIVDEDRRSLSPGEVGELALWLDRAQLGYYKAPELTAGAMDEAGWYYTGDLATMDERGYVRIVGRRKDMIIRGGQNVYPAEIERQLLNRPDVENAAVVGVPETLAGERVWAFIIPKAGAALQSTDILDYCRVRMAGYKIPDQIRFVDTFPVTSTGKVQKFVLREMALAEGTPGEGTRAAAIGEQSRQENQGAMTWQS